MKQGTGAQFARLLMSRREPRWSHIRGVAEAAERLVASSPILDEMVVEAAWLHDVGYAPSVQKTGFHALDGARLLVREGFDDELVSLVCFHTGAEFEAEERGLLSQLECFSRPDQGRLDALILADLSVSPLGSRVHPVDRLAEILARYGPSDPVHKAVRRSRGYLLDCARRAATATGSPEVWGFPGV